MKKHSDQNDLPTTGATVDTSRRRILQGMGLASLAPERLQQAVDHSTVFIGAVTVTVARKPPVQREITESVAVQPGAGGAEVEVVGTAGSVLTGPWRGPTLSDGEGAVVVDGCTGYAQP